MRLGKHPKKLDRRNLQLARYLPLRLPTPPLKIDHASKLPANIGMMGNDVHSDCTVAAAGHMVQEWTEYADGSMLTLSDIQILAAYKVVSPNDDGAYMLDILNYWRKTGIGIDKIEAFLEVTAGDLVQAKLAIQYFGSLYMGMGLPDVNTMGPWDVVNPTWRPNPNNGHAICLFAYDDALKMFKAATWGKIVNLSYGWFLRYTDECYAVLNDIMLSKQTGKSPEGFDWAALTDDLTHIGDAPVPAPTPVPTPTPTPTNLRPIQISAKTPTSWIVYLNTVAQMPSHPTDLEAIQHADVLRWANPGSVIEVRGAASYKVT